MEKVVIKSSKAPPEPIPPHYWHYLKRSNGAFLPIYKIHQWYQTTPAHIWPFTYLVPGMPSRLRPFKVLFMQHLYSRRRLIDCRAESHNPTSLRRHKSHHVMPAGPDPVVVEVHWALSDYALPIGALHLG